MVSLQKDSMTGRPYVASFTLPIESNEVTTLLTTGKPPCVSTGEWRPLPWAMVILATLTGIRTPMLTTWIVSPTVTSFDFLSVEQHTEPTGR